MEFLLPDLGEGVQEGEITRWLVQAGETVREDQPLLEVMTDKVTAEIPSPVDGKVLDLLQPEGAVVPVGTPLLRIQAEDEDAAPTMGCEVTQPRNGHTAEVAAPSSQLPVPGQDDGMSHGARQPRGSVRSREPGSSRSVTGPRSETTSREPRAERPPRAVPMVRKLARDLGVELESVAGTGPAGRITEADVRAAAGPAGVPAEPVVVPRPVAPSPAHPHAVRVPIRGLRRRIADHMLKAMRTTAPATFVDEVDLTELVALREKARDTAERQGLKLTFLPFVMKAAAAALREHPRLNAIVDEEREEILLSREYHIGVACETPEGLVVPVIRDVDRKGIFDLAREITEKGERARTGHLERADLQGGSFSITSMGRFGGLMATPILNYPEVAILAVHRIVRRPVYQGEAIVPRDVANLSLTFDHRALDGLDAARFVSTLIHYLEDPSLLLFS